MLVSFLAAPSPWLDAGIGWETLVGVDLARYRE